MRLRLARPLPRPPHRFARSVRKTQDKQPVVTTTKAVLEDERCRTDLREARED
jgi:hypothetical protein